jgi:hypothetical protein
MASVWEYETAGEWHFRIRPARWPNRWYGEAKRGPFMDERGGPWEPGDLWFEFADTKEAVLQNLKAEVLH